MHKTVSFNMKKRNTILNFFYIGLFTLLLFGCGQKQSENTNEFIYDNGNKKIELVLEGGKHHLIIDKPTKANFVTENIDHAKFTIVGAGIRRITQKNSDYDWEITALKRHLTNGKLQIRMMERIENGVNLSAEFLVDVKTE